MNLEMASGVLFHLHLHLLLHCEATTLASEATAKCERRERETGILIINFPSMAREPGTLLINFQAGDREGKWEG